ncbi:MAG: type II CRISPR RNA-guided endonuclease Cas9 [Alphaproteobacteria bacterium]|nr:type II CRISPR RNA-guided endonuclease Cas9 [Alphaproteobacteria bacterium]
MRYVLGLDLGETSLGWSIIETKDGAPYRFENFGVRIFSDGRDSKTKEPLAVARRTARGMRKRRDRFVMRRETLMNRLIKYGLMPQDEAERKALEMLDPYFLRAKALDEKLTPYELGRALFHINQRRGFKSNLKTDKKDAETGAMKTAIAETRKRMTEAGARTLGEYLYLMNKDKTSTQDFVPVRAKSIVVKSKASYPLYPDRAMYEDEFRQIMTKQGLSKEIEDDLFHIIFNQRPLKQPELGLCQFEEGERRAYCAYPAFQQSRLLQQINQLKILYDDDERFLTPEEREVLYRFTAKDFSALDKKKRTLTWSAAKKLLKPFGVNPKVSFNLESEKRKGLDADTTAAQLADESCFGKEWFSFDREKQNEIVALLLNAQDESKLIEELKDKYALSPEQAEAVAHTSLEDGTASLSLKALGKINPFLREGQPYHQAVESAGYTFSLKTKGTLPEYYNTFINPETGDVYDELPYYGEAMPKAVIGGTNAAADKDFPEKYWGKINNPTVHIALNQVRKLINELVKRYGHPESIVVELARELKLGKKAKDELNKLQTENTKDNDRIAKELERLGVKNSYDNRMKYKLWEDSSDDSSQRCCPFCGKPINFEHLFSDEFEIEHLLPFARSYSDARTNKVISCRACNREKGNRSPWEAFHADEKRWNEILGRVENFSLKHDEKKNRAKKFREDAFQDLDDVLARMLTDTQYMARVARQYLCFAANPSKVWGIPGQLTAKLRHHWGLESLFPEDQKDRTDHRHHALDAFIVACTGRGTLQKYATERRDYSTQMPQEKAPHLPYPEFRLRELQDAFDRMVISHKPDHGNPQKAIQEGKTVAKLHEETYYGFAGEGDKKRTWKLIQRVPVTEFKTEADLDIIIDQAGTADKIRALLDGKDKSEHEAIIQSYFADRNTRKVRTYRERNKNVILPFKDKNGKPYRYAIYGGNAYAEIYCPDRGKNAGKWQIEIIPNYCAHQKDFVPKWRHTDAHAKLIMRLHIDDMVAYEKDGETIIARVKKMTGILFYLRPHLIAKEEADKLSWAASAEQFRLHNGRKITVTIDGRVIDPKRPEGQADG